jgi:hypothetical protein
MIHLIPISLWGGNATASDKKNSVRLIPGTITQITKEVVVETDNNTTLDLLVVVEKEKEKEKVKEKKEKAKEEEKEKDKDKAKHKRK